MNWWIQRIAVSDSYSADPHTIRCGWSFADVFEAHATLDAVEDMREFWRQKAEADAGRDS